MSWISYEITLEARNTSNIADTHKLTLVLQGLGIMYAPTQHDLGKRTPDIDGREFNNTITQDSWKIAVRRFRIDAGEWDMGDFRLLIRGLRASDLWITAIRESAKNEVETKADGTDYDTWVASGADSHFPIKVIAEYNEPQYDFKLDRWMEWALTLRNELPTIGVVIP